MIGTNCINCGKYVLIPLDLDEDFNVLNVRMKDVDLLGNDPIMFSLKYDDNVQLDEGVQFYCTECGEKERNKQN